MNSQLKLNIKRKKISVYQVLIYLYIIMPIIDSISGALHDVYPVGQAYRIVTLAYMVILLGDNSEKEFKRVIVPFLFFMFIQMSISSAYIIKSIQSTLKLFTPIVAIGVFRILLKKKKVSEYDIFKILDIWSIVYPIMILIPGIFGIGINAYDGSIGWKGFFYATNEISFILSSLIMYLFWKFEKNGSIKTLIVLAANCLCIVLMGTKTGYATIALFSLIFILEFLKGGARNKFIKISLLLILFLMLLFLNIDKIVNLASAVFERWFYQRGLSYSTTDFLFSMRLRRLEGALDIYANIRYLLFGWGLGGEMAGFPNMEMDFLDILFRMGIIGLFYVAAFYGREVIRIAPNNVWGLIIVGWSLALSFGAGHVLFYGQSGMMLAINFLCAYIIGNLKKEKKPLYD